MNATKSKMGRPALKESQRRVWKGMRLSPQAASRLERMVESRNSNAGQIVSQLIEGVLTVLPLNK